MAGYVIAQYRVTDPEGIQQYVEAVMPILMAHGAEVLAADHGAQTMEGEAPPTTIVLKFASVDAAKAWYNSPEYQAVKHFRTDHSEDGRMVIADGFVMPG